MDYYRFSVEEFVEHVNLGFITDWDGSAYLAHDLVEANEPSSLSEIMGKINSGLLREGKDYIHWYNK